MLTSLFSRLVILVFGTLYPAYASYKTVKTKNVKQYVKWTMYWVVFASFTCIEIFTDIFLSWFPFYYEAKVLFLWWLVSTNGSKYIFVKILYPLLNKHEQVIDAYIASFWSQWYDIVYSASSQGADYIKALFFELLQKGHIAAFSGTSNLQQNEIDAALLSSQAGPSSDIPDLGPPLDDEDFDVLSVEEVTMPNKVTSKRGKKAKKEYDSESSVDDGSSVQKRPLKVSKPKTRTGLRQRKKNDE